MLRIFKWRINIIDFIVFLFFLCLMPMFYFGWKLTTRKPPVVETVEIPKPKEIEMYYELKAQVDNFLKEHKQAKKYFR